MAEKFELTGEATKLPEDLQAELETHLNAVFSILDKHQINSAEIASKIDDKKLTAKRHP